MKEGDIVGHGLYPNRIGYITKVFHAEHGPIVSYNVEWLNGAYKGKDTNISAFRVIDMQAALERAQGEAADREKALVKWRAAAKLAAK